MHDIKKLKEMLCEELEEYGRKGELSAGELDIVDKLAHAVKNLGKVMEKAEEEEYSNRNGPYYMDSYGGSYARGRGQGARRDSMGRYSRNNYGDSRASEDMVDQLRDMMGQADESTRKDIQRLIDKMERM